MVLSLSSYSTRVALLLTTTAATLLLLTLAHFGPPRFRPLASTMAPTPTQQLESLTVGTLNLRYDGSWRETVPVGQPGDGRDATYRPGGDDGYGEKPWSERRWRILAALHFHRLAVVAFQEALHSQVLDLQAMLGPTWEHVGVGRDDGREAGEYSPLFYQTTRFERISWETVWLSPEPSKPGSVGWDASQTRIATLLSLKERSTGRIVHLAATHWDDRGLKARAQSGKMLRVLVPERARSVERKLGLGDGLSLAGVVLLLGDLNSPVTEDGYRLLTTASNEDPLRVQHPSSIPIPTSPPFHDTLHLLPPRPASAFGPSLTYTGFNRFDSGTRIDFVFLYDALGEGAGWAVQRYGVVENWVDEDAHGWKGRWSDHRLVVCELVQTEEWRS